ncbi:unnamed protein product [Darwinula stevensoni]|uniref:G-protein coupled receptors family 1 profile domain-containing protein n=1 Tax=Darwinula stevensoni TaxID=69355 RepID=A0A7R9A5V9_9CRUS|nr:unnamed protein product [Darwinula stevensoni]CAG0886106.1 unnamed protein product [Darwinula stevensoni]
MVFAKEVYLEYCSGLVMAVTTWHSRAATVTPPPYYQAVKRFSPEIIRKAFISKPPVIYAALLEILHRRRGSSRSCSRISSLLRGPDTLDDTRPRRWVSYPTAQPNGPAAGIARLRNRVAILDASAFSRCRRRGPSTTKKRMRMLDSRIPFEEGAQVPLGTSTREVQAVHGAIESLRDMGRILTHDDRPDLCMFRENMNMHRFCPLPEDRTAVTYVESNAVTVSNRALPLGNQPGLVVSLVASNLVSSCILVPSVMLDLVDWTLTPAFVCHLLNGISSVCFGTAVMASLGIHVDRYFAVLHPLRYRHHITRARVLGMIGVTWAVPVVLAVAGGLVLDPPLEGDWHVCIEFQMHHGPEFRLWHVGFGSLVVVFLFLAPVAVQLWIYFNIYREAHKNSERTRRSSLGDVKPPLTRQNSALEKMKHRISNASSYLYRDEGRTVKFSVLVHLSSLLCWGPYALHLLLASCGVDLPQTVHTVSIVLLLTYAAISPFLYGYQNRKVIRELSRLFGVSRGQDACLPRSRPRSAKVRPLPAGAVWKVDEKGHVGSTWVDPRHLLPPKPRGQGDGGRGSVSSGSSHVSEMSSASIATTITDILDC